MSDLERRVMLGAMGVGALAALAKAGPITPPAGAVGPTGRTLDEVFNRIPGGGAGDGRIAIAGGTSGVIISQPGSYVLTGDIVFALGTGITINADNVTLDLNGYAVRGTTASSVGVAAAFRSRLHVRNGRIAGGQVGVSLGLCPETVVEDLQVDGCSVTGVLLSGTSAFPSGVVRRCVVTNIGAGAPAGATVTAGVRLLSLNGVVEGCVVNSVVNANAGGQAFGIQQTQGTRVVLENNRVIGAPIGIGANNSTSVVWRGNVVLGSVTAFSGGVLTNDGGGNIPTP